MLPVNPSQMSALLKQLGIYMEGIDEVEEVIIRTSDKEIVIFPKDVKKMTGQGMITFQIIADHVEERDREGSGEINEEDVEILKEKAGLSDEEARKLLKKHKGDLAAALMEAENETS